MRAFFDTNIVIDLLRELPAAIAEIARYSKRAISAVTWIEVLVGVPSEDRSEVEALLTTFERIDLDETIMRRTVEVRRTSKMKLTDAIIYASALERGLLFVTRDTKSLPEGATGVRVSYTF